MHQPIAVALCIDQQKKYLWSRDLSEVGRRILTFTDFSITVSEARYFESWEWAIWPIMANMMLESRVLAAHTVSSPSSFERSSSLETPQQMSQQWRSISFCSQLLSENTLGLPPACFSRERGPRSFSCCLGLLWPLFVSYWQTRWLLLICTWSVLSG